MVEHPVQLGERHPQPGGPLGHLHAHQAFHREHHAQLVGERREPVVPVGQHDDLPVVAHLEQLLRAPVHVTDDRLAGDHPLAVEHQLQPQHTVRGRVLRADVEHHVGAELLVAGAGDQPGPGADGQFTEVPGVGGHARHRATAGPSGMPTGWRSHQCPPSPAGSVSSATADAAASARTYPAGSVPARLSGGRPPSAPSARSASRCETREYAHRRPPHRRRRPSPWPRARSRHSTRPAPEAPAARPGTRSTSRRRPVVPQVPVVDGHREPSCDLSDRVGPGVVSLRPISARKPDSRAPSGHQLTGQPVASAGLTGSPIVSAPLSGSTSTYRQPSSVSHATSSGTLSNHSVASSTPLIPSGISDAPVDPVGQVARRGVPPRPR